MTSTPLPYDALRLAPARLDATLDQIGVLCGDYGRNNGRQKLVTASNSMTIAASSLRVGRMHEDYVEQLEMLPQLLKSQLGLSFQKDTDGSSARLLKTVTLLCETTLKRWAVKTELRCYALAFLNEFLACFNTASEFLWGSFNQRPESKLTDLTGHVLKLVNQDDISLDQLRELPMVAKSAADSFLAKGGKLIAHEELEATLLKFEVELMVLSLTNDDEGVRIG